MSLSAYDDDISASSFYPSARSYVQLLVLSENVSIADEVVLLVVNLYDVASVLWQQHRIADGHIHRGQTTIIHQPTGAD